MNREVMHDFYNRTQNKSYHMISINGERAFYTYDMLQSQFFRSRYSLCEEKRLWDWKYYGSEIKENISKYEDKREKLKKILVK